MSVSAHATADLSGRVTDWRDAAASERTPRARRRTPGWWFQVAVTITPWARLTIWAAVPPPAVAAAAGTGSGRGAVALELPRRSWTRIASVRRAGVAGHR